MFVILGDFFSSWGCPMDDYFLHPSIFLAKRFARIFFYSVHFRPCISSSSQIKDRLVRSANRTCAAVSGDVASARWSTGWLDLTFTSTIMHWLWWALNDTMLRMKTHFVPLLLSFLQALAPDRCRRLRLGRLNSSMPPFLLRPRDISSQRPPVLCEVRSSGSASKSIEAQ
jgi:hypothetical protein